MKRQLELIRERILGDTNVYVKNSPLDGLIRRDDGTENKAMSYCRPLLIVNDMIYTDINNETKNKSIVQLAEFLTEDIIKDVVVVKDTQTAALYGTRASCGVILLTTKNRRSLKKIKKIDFGYN